MTNIERAVLNAAASNMTIAPNERTAPEVIKAMRDLAARGLLKELPGGKYENTEAGARAIGLA